MSSCFFRQFLLVEKELDRLWRNLHNNLQWQERRSERESERRERGAAAARCFRAVATQLQHRGSGWLAAQKPIVLVIRNVKANWKQPLKGEEGGISLLGVGWHQATVRRQKKGQANWFPEQTGADHGVNESAVLGGYCSHTKAREKKENRCIGYIALLFLRIKLTLFLLQC